MTIWLSTCDTPGSEWRSQHEPPHFPLERGCAARSRVSGTRIGERFLHAHDRALPPGFKGGPYNGSNFTAAYHTFGLDREENSITFYVDGVPETQPYSTVIGNTTTPTSTGPFAYLPSDDTHDPINIWLTDVASGSYMPTDAIVTTRAAVTPNAQEPGTPPASRAGPGLRDLQHGRQHRQLDADDPERRQLRCLLLQHRERRWVKLTAAPIAVPAGNATTVTMTSSGSVCARAENVKLVRVD